MSQVKFEGDVSDFSARQLEYITIVFAEKGFNNSVVSVKPVGEAGDNYMANVKRLIADKDGKTLSIVVKVAPKIEQFRAIVGTRNLFINEHLMYTEVLPKFTELEKDAGIPESDRLRYATCFGTFIEECEEIILLEDLKESNFTMLDRFKFLEDNVVKLVLKTFARYHSLSYALKHKEPDTYDNFRYKLHNHWGMMSDDEHRNEHFEKMEKDCITLLKDKKHIDAVKGSISKIIQHTKKLSDTDANSRFSVIQQGDAWVNNIMFSMQEGMAISCCMIDYQLTTASIPVADLGFFIFNCTDYETRKSHFFDWIDYYHSELDTSLSKFGLKANYVYPKDQLYADFKRHGKIAIAQCVMLAFLMTRETAQAEEIKETFNSMTEENMHEMADKMGISTMEGKTLKLFLARVQGVVDSLLELGFYEQLK